MATIIRPATREDVLCFTGELQKSSRVWAAEYNGKLAGIAGIQKYNKNYHLVFSHIDVDAPDITVWRGALKLFDKIKSLGVPLVAAPDHDKAKKFLLRLGFQEVNGGFIWVP